MSDMLVGHLRKSWGRTGDYVVKSNELFDVLRVRGSVKEGHWTAALQDESESASTLDPRRGNEDRTMFRARTHQQRCLTLR